MTKLSRNFTLEELTFSEVAARNGWENMPSTEQIINLRRLCELLLQPIREAIGPVIVNSGFRSEQLNAAIGSKPTSAHCDGRAADIRSLSMRPLILARVIEELDLPFDQLIHEYGRWVHVGIAKHGVLPRRQLLTIDALSTRTGLWEIR